ncbi:DUF6266 family protein [Carboxylicivirga sp. RSCT41]|uniref:DUF6266 family protein n=1 Tax=Carboxylicivirga agarovorans TaxID=3417570 RepID=UPI003D348854
MARFKSINDGTSGKVGNVITYQMYGKSYMRSLPGQYTDKKSERQLAQRQKMQLVNNFLGPYKDVLRLTFKNEAVGRSAFLAAKSYNILHAIRGEYPDQYIDYNQALVSTGTVFFPQEARAERIDEGLHFYWKNEGLNSPHDSLLVIAGLRGQHAVMYKQTEAQRLEESYVWKLDLQRHETYDVWMVFRDYRERGFSNSVWLGQY